MAELIGGKNLVLVGMPGAGKSTVGVLLAKQLAMDFVDTDLLIQVCCGAELQEIVDDQGYLELRRIEEEVILRTHFDHSVIATGGSAVYSPAAMAHLQNNGIILFLDVAFEEIEKRVQNFNQRGIARRADQSLADLYQERSPLYRRYADLTIEIDDLSHDEVVQAVIIRLDEV